MKKPDLLLTIHVPAFDEWNKDMGVYKKRFYQRVPVGFYSQKRVRDLTATQRYVYSCLLDLCADFNSSTIQVDAKSLQSYCKVKAYLLQSCCKVVADASLISITYTCANSIVKYSYSKYSAPPDVGAAQPRVEIYPPNDVVEEENIGDFQLVYKKYPRKVGKSRGIERLRKTVKTTGDYQSLMLAVDNYVAHIKRLGTEEKYIKHFSSFAGCWRDYLDVEPDQTEMTKEQADIIMGGDK